MVTICLLATMVVASKANVCVRCTTPDRTTSQCFTEAFCRENRPGNLLVRVHPGHPEYDCVRVPAKWQKQVGNPCASRGYLLDKIREQKVRRKKREKRREEREKRGSSRNPGNLRKPTKSYIFDEAEENVGGGRVYGEYNKGPYKAGAEYNWDEAEENVGDSYWTNRWLNNMDEAEENVGGGRVYGEYNKGPYKAGAEYNWDEEEGDERVGGFMNGFKCGSCAANHGRYKCKVMGYC